MTATLETPAPNGECAGNGKPLMVYHLADRHSAEPPDKPVPEKMLGADVTRAVDFLRRRYGPVWSRGPDRWQVGDATVTDNGLLALAERQERAYQREMAEMRRRRA